MKNHEVKNNEVAGRYELTLDGAVAVLDYEQTAPGTVALTHTGVPREFEGQGIASRLTEFALADLRRRGMKVVPLCGFCAAYIRRHPQWQDMLAGE